MKAAGDDSEDEMEWNDSSHPLAGWRVLLELFHFPCIIVIRMQLFAQRSLSPISSYFISTAFICCRNHRQGDAKSASEVFLTSENLSLREGQGQKLIASDQWPKTFIVSFYYGPDVVAPRRQSIPFIRPRRLLLTVLSWPWRNKYVVELSVEKRFGQGEDFNCNCIATWIEVRPFWTTSDAT